MKPNPSLGSLGIQGRMIPEAIGCELHPFLFKIDGVNIAVPNPVTWAIMKIVAMRDRWQESQNQNKTGPDRDAQMDQARKHAQDTCRILAMMTREEYDRIDDILGTIREIAVFKNTCAIIDQFFKNEADWGCRVVQSMYNPDDFHTIRETLLAWFPQTSGLIGD